MNKIEKLVEAFKELDAGGETALKEIGSDGALFIADKGDTYAVGVRVKDKTAAFEMLGILLENIRDRAEPDMDLAEFGWRLGMGQIIIRKLHEMKDDGIEIDAEELFRQMGGDKR